MAGGDLHVAQADAGVEHGRHERMPEHVRVHPGHADAGCAGQVFEPAGGGVAVHPPANRVAQDRPVGAAVDGAVAVGAAPGVTGVVLAELVGVVDDDEELELDIEEMSRNATPMPRTPMTMTVTMGLSFSDFLIASPSARRKEAPACRHRPA